MMSLDDIIQKLLGSDGMLQVMKNPTFMLVKRPADHRNGPGPSSHPGIFNGPCKCVWGPSNTCAAAS